MLLSPDIEVRAVDDLQQISNASFRASWDALAGECKWSSYPQRSSFVVPWYRSYHGTHTPCVVCGWCDDKLIGLLALALPVGGGAAVVAGTHQAEYQSWITTPTHAVAFLRVLVPFLTRRFGGLDLTFRYVPSSLAVDQLIDAGYRSRITVLAHSRPLMRIDGHVIAKSLAKKANRSRLNRLKKLGPVELERIETTGAFEQVFDDIIWQYDLRQGAVNRSTPFLQDPAKRSFYHALMDEGDALHVTVLRVGEAVASAHIDHPAERWMHLGIPSHSPFLVDHSPGKLHMLLLADRLAREDVDVFDLTPGGDAWKERFANDHDVVFTLTLHHSQLARLTRRVPLMIRSGVTGLIRRAGLEPRRVKAAVSNLLRTKPRGPSGIGSDRDGLHRIVPPDELIEVAFPGFTTSVNRPADLLAVPPEHANHGQLAAVLDRLERGHHLLTCIHQEKLVCYAFVAFDPIGLGMDAGTVGARTEDDVVLHGFTSSGQVTSVDMWRPLVDAVLRHARSRKPRGSVFASAGDAIVRELLNAGCDVVPAEFRLDRETITLPGAGAERC